MATKTTTIRLPKELLKEIDERCEKNGTCRNDFIKNAIDNQLELEAEEEIEKPKSTEQPKYKVIIDADTPGRTKGIVTKVSYDNGKTWFDVKENN